MRVPVHIVLGCAEEIRPRVRYVFDTLFMAMGAAVTYSQTPPADGPWILYGTEKDPSLPLDRCLCIGHSREAWRLFSGVRDIDQAHRVDRLTAVLPQVVPGFATERDICFDIAANAFYFLSSWSERLAPGRGGTRRTFDRSVFARLRVSQYVVDEYLERLTGLLDVLCGRIGAGEYRCRTWPQDAAYAVVLSHDVDFIPAGVGDMALQGVKTVLRHLIRQRDPADALRAALGLAKAVAGGRDPYGCVHEILRREKALGVRSSFQVAVGHRHPHDVNYHVRDGRTRDYLRAIIDAGFDLCLHGSYRSTEEAGWYEEEVAVLTENLIRPVGSRQHYLSFDYDALFGAQERAGIQYDMSMGFPDRIGPRAGFSYPYFPYCLNEDRPYNVLQISLFLMDVTLRGYMGLKGERAWEATEAVLGDVRGRGGCVSVVWHPIVFAGARDPGYDRIYWRLVEYVRGTGGLATDGRTINAFWRDQAKEYSSFAFEKPRGACAGTQQ